MRTTSLIRTFFAAGLIASGYSGPVSAQDQQKPVKVVEGAEPGVKMEVLSLNRDEGGLLTLRVAFVNESGGQVNNGVLPGKGNVEQFALLDYANHRKYLV